MNISGYQYLFFAIVDNKNKEKEFSAGMWCAQVTSGDVYGCTNIAGRKISLQDFLSGKLQTGFKNKLSPDCRLKNLFCDERRAIMQNRRGKTNTSSNFKNVHLKSGEDG